MRVNKKQDHSGEKAGTSNNRCKTNLGLSGHVRSMS